MHTPQKKGHTYWYSQLLSLGIMPELISKSGIKPDSYEGLYLSKTQQDNFSLTETWQLRALSGDVTLYEDIIDKKDSVGANLAHYAAWSGNPEALKWVHNNAPGLLKSKDKDDLTIVDYATWSGNPRQFNYSLDLAGDPTYYFLSKKLLHRTATVSNLLMLLNKALDHNFIVDIEVEKEVDNLLNNLSAESAVKEQLKEINTKLIRNSGVQRDITHFQNHSLLSPKSHQRQSPDTLKKAFRFNLPTEVSQDNFSRLFDYAQRGSAIKAINLTEQKVALCALIDKERARLQSVHKWAIFFGLVKSGNEKTNMLNTLKQLVKNYNFGEGESLQEKISQWEKQNGQLIDQKRNTIHAFFDPRHKTSTRKLIEEINKQLKSSSL